MSPDAAAIARLRARDKRTLGETVSRFEDDRPDGLRQRHALLAALDHAGATPRARWIGITGAPGVGKSSLLGPLGLGLVARGLAVAIVAVDPSSPTSGGALLGDRARVRLPPGEDRIYFRSQASELELGGLGRHTLAIGRLLERLFDVLLIETVGVGQSERAIVALVDRSLLVVQPHAGDHLQLMKAGLLELVDRVVMNKSDLDGAGAALAVLRGQLGARVASVSARSGAGLAELVELVAATPGRRTPAERDAHGLEAWVAAEYGRAGQDFLAGRAGGAAALVGRAGGLEPAFLEFSTIYRGSQAD